MAGITKEETQARIYDYAWNYVNTCAGNKTASYNKACGVEHNRHEAWDFHNRHKEEVERLIKQFREENRAEYPHIRDNNISLLLDIAVNGSNRDKISAIKELDSIFGFNSTNVSVNGKVDSDIELVITNL